MLDPLFFRIYRTVFLNLCQEVKLAVAVGKRIRTIIHCQAVADFINNLLDRRLPMLDYLLTFPNKNISTIQAEIQLLKVDLNNLLKKINCPEAKNQNSETDTLLIETEADVLIKAIDEEI